ICCRLRSKPLRRGRTPKRKTQGLKQAKEAAHAETEQYEGRGSEPRKLRLWDPLAVADLSGERDPGKMTILQTCFWQNREEVLDNLLTFVCDIKPEIHKNYCFNG
uniref:Uncharacterized protein n=1 Tax=Equus asinus TaxID=9793 RepID=A0A9L0JAR0_EQUAS